MAIMLGALTCGFMLPRRRPVDVQPDAPVIAVTASPVDFDSDRWAEMRTRLNEEIEAVAEGAMAEAGAALSGSSPGGAATSSFKDCNVQPPEKGKCLARVIRAPNAPVETTIAADLSMKGMPLVTPTANPASPETAGSSTISGTVPMMMEPESWPEWLLFCERVDILHRWGPDEVLAVLYMKLPIVNIRIESMLYIRYFDLLDEDGCVGVQIAGGGRLAKMAQRLGIPAPAPLDRGQVFKADCDYVHVSIYPDEMSRHMRFLLTVVESIPMDWVIRYIWGTLGARLMGILAGDAEKRRAKGRSQSDEGFSEAAAQRRFAFYQGMERRMAEALTVAHNGIKKTRKVRCPSEISTSASEKSEIEA